MNDPLRTDQPSGLRNAVYGMMGTMVIFLVSVIWYGSQMAARFDARLTALENQQTLSRAIEEKLNDAREDTRVHFAQTDEKFADLSSKMAAILEILQQDNPPPSGGSQNVAPENFLPNRGDAPTRTP